jgi:hypothetical protein
MDSATPGERVIATSPAERAEQAIDFVRFCHRRRRVGWPELYDEMCAVAGRGLYRGYGPDDLKTIGIGLGLFQMPALAGLVGQVVAEDVERRRRSALAAQTRVALDAADGAVMAPDAAVKSLAQTSPTPTYEPKRLDVGVADTRSIRLAVPAGA